MRAANAFLLISQSACSVEIGKDRLEMKTRVGNFFCAYRKTNKNTRSIHNYSYGTENISTETSVTKLLNLHNKILHAKNLSHTILQSRGHSADVWRRSQESLAGGQAPGNGLLDGFLAPLDRESNKHFL